MIIDQLRFAIKHNYNVMLRGPHGVGKSHLILQAIEEQGYSYLYFSGATMDAYTNFVGIPFRDPETGNLDFCLPSALANDDIDIIVVDEFNRAPLPVKNALMELLQFKAINGRPFNRLKMVWAAINPADDDDAKYDVEEMDSAQLDRFHIIIDVPRTVDVDWFTRKFGDLGRIAANWWQSLPEESKKICSPRRLEYATDVYKNGGELSMVLDSRLHIAGLKAEFAKGSIADDFRRAINDDDSEKLIAMLENVSNLEILQQHFIQPAIDAGTVDPDLRFLKYSSPELMFQIGQVNANLTKLFAVGMADENDAHWQRLRTSYLESEPGQMFLSEVKTHNPKLHDDYVIAKGFKQASTNPNAPTQTAGNAKLPTRSNHVGDIAKTVKEFSVTMQLDGTGTNERLEALRTLGQRLGNEPLEKEDATQFIAGMVAFLNRAQYNTITKEYLTVAKLLNYAKHTLKREIHHDKARKLKQDYSHVF